MSDRHPDGIPKIPSQMCLNCGYAVSASSHPKPNDKTMPYPGAVVMCLNCGDLTFFDEQMRLRRATATEAADPRFQHLLLLGKRSCTMAKGNDLRKKRGGRV